MKISSIFKAIGSLFLFDLSFVGARLPTPIYPKPLRYTTPNPIPARRRARSPLHPIDIHETCNSPDFEPTITNWHSSQAYDFLHNFTTTHTQLVKTHGLLRAISTAFNLSKFPPFSLDNPYQCYLTCESLLREFADDLHTARAIYFTFGQASNIAIAFKTFHDGLVTAQISVSQMIPKMVEVFVDQMGPPGVEMDLIKEVANFLVQRLSGWVMSELPATLSADQILAMVQAEINEQEKQVEALKEQRKGRDLVSFEAQERRAGQLLAAAKGTGMVGTLAEGAAANEISGVVTGWASEALGTVQGWGMPKGGGKAGELVLQDFVRIGCTGARVALKRLAGEMFQGPTKVGENGTTLLSEMIYDGAFMAPVGEGGDMDIFQGADIELKIAHTVLLKTLNALWTTHPIFISCTPDLRISPTPDRPTSDSPTTFPPASSCLLDTSGPQDSKTCLTPSTVCYLYAHDTSGPPFTHHLTTLLGHSTFTSPPYSISPSDIITSSVLTSSSPSSASTFALASTLSAAANSTESLEASFSPSSLGMFSLPVCYSQYNWNTVTIGNAGLQTLWNDVSPFNTIKSLPCHCGIWGRDTASILVAMNLDPDAVRGRCARQIVAHIEDPFERWIALCRVRVKKVLKGGITVKGEREECRGVLGVVDGIGGEPEEMRTTRPELVRGLECFVGVAKEKVKGQKSCKEILKKGKGRKELADIVAEAGGVGMKLGPQEVVGDARPTEKVILETASEKVADDEPLMAYVELRVVHEEKKVIPFEIVTYTNETDDLYPTPSPLPSPSAGKQEAGSEKDVLSWLGGGKKEGKKKVKAEFSFEFEIPDEGSLPMRAKMGGPIVIVQPETEGWVAG